MKIELEIPKEIIDHCRDLNISDVNIPFLFKDYCQDKLGVYVGLAGNEFRNWSKETDNVTDYVSTSKTELVEIKMVVEITMDSNKSVNDAVQELSDNLAESDLISTNGCIVDGKVEQFMILLKK